MAAADERSAAIAAAALRVGWRDGRVTYEPEPANMPTSCTVGELFAHVPAELKDGVCDLLVTRIESRGTSKVMHVEDEKRRWAKVTLGSAGQARNKRLRILLGTSDVEDVKSALEGKNIRVRLTSYTIHGSEYRGVERA